MVSIEFYGDRVFLVEWQNEPYVPVKPICENLGLDWPWQYRKLKNEAKRWQIVSVPAQAGKAVQDLVCIPLRKLPAWLMSISPSKVKPEIREKLVRYQEECDRVLWEYWFKGRAVGFSLQKKGLTTEDVRKIVREEMAVLDRHIELARRQAYAEGLKAGLELVARYEKCHRRRKPAHFLLDVLALGGWLSTTRVARLTGASARAVQRAKKVLSEAGLEAEDLQLSLFQKTRNLH